MKLPIGIKIKLPGRAKTYRAGDFVDDNLLSEGQKKNINKLIKIEAEKKRIEKLRLAEIEAKNKKPEKENTPVLKDDNKK